MTSNLSEGQKVSSGDDNVIAAQRDTNSKGHLQCYDGNETDETESSLPNLPADLEDQFPFDHPDGDHRGKEGHENPVDERISIKNRRRTILCVTVLVILIYALGVFVWLKVLEMNDDSLAAWNGMTLNRHLRAKQSVTPDPYSLLQTAVTSAIPLLDSGI